MLTTFESKSDNSVRIKRLCFPVLAASNWNMPSLFVSRSVRQVFCLWVDWTQHVATINTHTHTPGFVQTVKNCFPGLSRTCKDQIPGFSRTHKTHFKGLSRINLVHKHGCIRSKKCTYQICYRCNCITVTMFLKFKLTQNVTNCTQHFTMNLFSS